MPHPRLPGQDELDTMCENARRVHELCQLIGGDIFRASELESGARARVGDLELHHHHHHPEDGAWILPEGD